MQFFAGPNMPSWFVVSLLPCWPLGCKMWLHLRFHTDSQTQVSLSLAATVAPKARHLAGRLGIGARSGTPGLQRLVSWRIVVATEFMFAFSPNCICSFSQGFHVWMNGAAVRRTTSARQCLLVSQMPSPSIRCWVATDAGLKAARCFCALAWLLAIGPQCYTQTTSRLEDVWICFVQLSHLRFLCSILHLQHSQTAKLTELFVSVCFHLVL